MRNMFVSLIHYGITEPDSDPSNGVELGFFCFEFWAYFTDSSRICFDVSPSNESDWFILYVFAFFNRCCSRRSVRLCSCRRSRIAFILFSCVAALTILEQAVIIVDHVPLSFSDEVIELLLCSHFESLKGESCSISRCGRSWAFWGPYSFWVEGETSVWSV